MIANRINHILARMLQTSPRKLAAIFLALCLSLLLAVVACERSSSQVPSRAAKMPTPEERGKYLVLIGGCNDCHTPGYIETDGKSPAESEWLTGSPVGFRGPWGTTFPPNLRLFMNETPEDDFVTIAKTRNQKPPMPWPSLHNMSEEDLRAIYRYVNSLGPKGQRAPEYVPPDQEPNFPYVVFTPQHLERLGAAAH